MQSALAIADILPSRPVAEQPRRAAGAPPAKSFGDALVEAGRDVERPKPEQTRPERPRDHDAQSRDSDAGEAHRRESRDDQGREDRPDTRRGRERPEGAVGRPDHARKGEAGDKPERKADATHETDGSEAPGEAAADSPASITTGDCCKHEAPDVAPEAAAAALTAEVVALADPASVTPAAPAPVVLPAADLLAAAEAAPGVAEAAAETVAAEPVATKEVGQALTLATTPTAAQAAPTAAALATAPIDAPAAAAVVSSAKPGAAEAASAAQVNPTAPEAAPSRGDAPAANAPLPGHPVPTPAARVDAALPSGIAGPAAEALASAGPSPSPTGQAGTAPQSAAASAPTPQHAMARAEAPVPLQALAVEVGMRAMRGSKEFQIRLDPEDLGRIDVRLEISEKGELQAKIAVERVETLNLLQRDARTLERAFDQAGLKTNPDGLQFTLKDPGQQGRDQGRGEEAPGRRSRSDHAAIDDLPAVSAIYRASAAGGLDIRI
jgi:flagellar hook-length control protein FliK